jgi:ribosomal protein L29
MAKKLSFKGKKPEEIQKLLGEKREELRTLRFTAAGGRTKDASLAGKVRKDIARLLTETTAQKNAAALNA